MADGRVPEAIDRYALALGNGASPRLVTEFADLLSRLGLREDAERSYRAAIARGTSAEAHANLALLLLDGGSPDAALIEFERSLALDPNVIEVRLNRANVLVELGQLSAASVEYETLTGHPDVAGAAWWGLAAIAEARGQPDAASSARAAAIAAAPDLARRCQSAGAVAAAV